MSGEGGCVESEWPDAKVKWDATDDSGWRALRADNERLRVENEVLRSYLSDELLRRLAVQHGWPHEPDNSLGRWCCDEHRDAFYGQHPQLGRHDG